MGPFRDLMRSSCSHHSSDILINRLSAWRDLKRELVPYEFPFKIGLEEDGGGEQNGSVGRSRFLPSRPKWARPSEKRAPTSPKLLEYSFLTSRFSVSRTPRTILCILTSSSSLGSFISSATHSCRVFLLSGSYAPPKPVVSRRRPNFIASPTNSTSTYLSTTQQFHLTQLTFSVSTLESFSHYRASSQRALPSYTLSPVISFKSIYLISSPHQNRQDGNARTALYAC